MATNTKYNISGTHTYYDENKKQKLEKSISGYGELITKNGIFDKNSDGEINFNDLFISFKITLSEENSDPYPTSVDSHTWMDMEDHATDADTFIELFGVTYDMEGAIKLFYKKQLAEAYPSNFWYSAGEEHNHIKLNFNKQATISAPTNLRVS
jgi:hypothetical protein